MTKEFMETKVQCETCEHLQEWTISKSYPQLPRVLIIHIARFGYDMKKIPTITPTPLEMDCFCTPCLKNHNRNHKYRLYGVVIHLGISQRSGHYFTFARTFDPTQLQCRSDTCCQMKFDQTETEGNNGNWFACNDDFVESLSQEGLNEHINVENSRYTPYLLFYVRNDLLVDH